MKQKDHLGTEVPGIFTGSTLAIPRAELSKVSPRMERIAILLQNAEIIDGSEVWEQDAQTGECSVRIMSILFPEQLNVLRRCNAIIAMVMVIPDTNPYLMACFRVKKGENCD